MRKLLLFVVILLFGVMCGACVNTLAVQQLNEIASEYMSNGNIPAAIARLESSVDLDPNIYESRYNLAVCYIRTGDCVSALKNIEEAKKLVQDEPAIFYTSGVTYDCLANQIYEKKNKYGELEKIVYKDKVKDYQMGLKYIDFLELANENYLEYAKLVPNGDDTQGVLEQINRNKEILEKKKAEYKEDKK